MGLSGNAVTSRSKQAAARAGSPAPKALDPAANSSSSFIFSNARSARISSGGMESVSFRGPVVPLLLDRYVGGPR